MRATLFISVLFFLIGTLSQAQENKFSFEEQYKVSSPVKLNISISDGDVNVHPGVDGTIKVYYSVYKRGVFVDISKKELAEYVIIAVKHDANLLDISVKSQSTYNWKNQYEVSFEVYAPVQTSCYLKTSDGDIMLSGLKADQKCHTSDGDIRVKKIDGKIELVTSDGDIDVAEINGEMDMETSDGDIEAEDVEGSLQMVTSDGDIEIKNVVGAVSALTSDGDIEAVDCSGSMTASTSDGDIHGYFLKVKNKLSFETSDGDINITVPKGMGLNLKLKGETLRSQLTGFSGKSSEHHIEGEINGGGIPVELITTDGTITLSFE
ncbi:MAG: DUF4097 domain-containing protein [Chlorobi bacterium]|nr:DUF4097 domain-containing protein [Chlorobiota bacterium]